ncbi:uncharacterized protein LOC128249787 isoform X2 [Octopus bimaculoides]|uniref:uncharacterized protein LOC128249787 isoform X2 n=1 Tax=Octopus bimaculoides TaxID=37653 RepID=UPI0022E8D30F|nr:uncharacterized protein LOC128249787 isoform X2 [Octopus bimaculoides]
MYFTRIHSMKYLLPTYILFLGFATSEFCIDSANQLCPLALEKYPLKQPDTNFCKRLDVFQHCFDAIFPNCNDYFHNVHAIRCKGQKPYNPDS